MDFLLDLGDCSIKFNYSQLNHPGIRIRMPSQEITLPLPSWPNSKKNFLREVHAVLYDHDLYLRRVCIDKGILTPNLEGRLYEVVEDQTV